MRTENELTEAQFVSNPGKKGKVTKKERILDLFRSGTHDIMEIARRLDTQTSYVARVLMDHGLLDGYFDLYTSSAYAMNVYSNLFQRRLGFKDVEAAKQSVRIIDEAHQELERRGDRAGQHHAQVMALTCFNRARWSGKPEEAAVFKDWLTRHMTLEPPTEADTPTPSEVPAAS